MGQDIHMMDKNTLMGHEWRVGSDLGRTIYAVTSDTNKKEHIVLGFMDTADLARHIVELHNASL